MPAGRCDAAWLLYRGFAVSEIRALRQSRMIGYFGAKCTTCFRPMIESRLSTHLLAFPRQYPVLSVSGLRLLGKTSKVLQTCYQRISDQSGYQPTTDQLAQLEQAACTLLDSLPIAQRDSFGIFEVGFYLHNPVTEVGVPEAFQMAIDAAKQRKPYYILFGKQSDATGLYTRFWVDLELPLGGEFSCLNLISPSQGLRSDLEFKYQYQVNTEYSKLGAEPSVYATAISTTLDSLTARIHEIKECCDNQQKGTSGCSACVLNREEIRGYLNAQGYIATPIKILNGNVARNDSFKNKVILPRIADLCSDITSIEIDGKICNDFPYIISHIMEAYPDAVSAAKISDDACVCNAGLEYFNAGPPYAGTQHIRVKMHLSRGVSGTGDDILYSQIFAPYTLGKLPFEAYIPNRIAESTWISPEHEGNINMTYVANAVESIFSKNGVSLTSISLQIPTPPHKQFDIYNGLTYHGNPPPSVGRSFSNLSATPDPSHFLYSGNFVQFYFFNADFEIFSNSNHLNYAIGNHFAHELLHQMIGRSIGYFKEYGLNEKQYEQNIVEYYNAPAEGHVIDQLNLLFPGVHFQSADEVTNCKFLTNDQKSLLKKDNGWKGQVKHLLPNEITTDYQQMEQISPGAKMLFTYLQIMRNLVVKYPDKTSCEVKCCSKVLVNTIRMMQLEKWDGF